MAVEFSPETAKKIDDIASRYPWKQAACLPALHIAQKEFGHLHDDALRAVAAQLDIAYAHVYGVATFYTMLRRDAAAPNVLRVCTNISCMLRGADEVLATFETRLGVKRGESTEHFTIIEEECLAACANAPAIVCGTRYFLDVLPEHVDQILSELRERPHPESEVV
jgi:NADH:ubiquinone oxidoreductase subunit E